MVQGVSIVDGFIENKNPATHEVISRVRVTQPHELDVLVATAASVQRTWAKVPAQERIDVLRKGLKLLATKRDKLVETIVLEMGKPKKEAEEEVNAATHKDKYLDLLLSALEPKRHGSSVVVRQPLGVVVVLSPWNFPADEILLLALPALGSGNTVIVKPSEVTPETGAIVVHTLAEVLPNKGILQLAQGDGAVGAQLVSHKSVNMIGMTGSSATGRKILHAAAPQLKRLVLELGGKDPMVIFEDADLDKAAADAVAYSLNNTGQVCSSIERIYVAQSVYDEVQTKVVKHAAEYKVGFGMDHDVKVGPLVSPMQRDIVEAHVQDALDNGAKLLYKSDLPENTKGNFYPVTVLADVKAGMRVYREETFGPVVCLIPFDGTEEEAIRLANDSEYGLASSIYTRDVEKAQRVAYSIEAGQVGINCYSLDNMDVACPWVGHKSSGFGYHSGQEGFHQFSVPKSLVYNP